MCAKRKLMEIIKPNAGKWFYSHAFHLPSGILWLSAVAATVYNNEWTIYGSWSLSVWRLNRSYEGWYNLSSVIFNHVELEWIQINKFFSNQRIEIKFEWICLNKREASRFIELNSSREATSWLFHIHGFVHYASIHSIYDEHLVIVHSEQQ